VELAPLFLAQKKATRRKGWLKGKTEGAGRYTSEHGTDYAMVKAVGHVLFSGWGRLSARFDGQ